MTLAELHSRIREYLYLPDTGALDMALAASVATRLKLGTPIWLILIGASSSGKSQMIRPFSYKSDFVHRVDDLTEATFISGVKTSETSLLLQIGSHGIIAISDLTTLFSKSPESRDAILGQLRLIYDGEYTKYFGNQKPVSWKGELGVIAGSTPSIYRHFEYVADMGERFIYYRLKDIKPEPAARKAMSNTIYGKELDEKIGEIYLEYLKGIVSVSRETPILSPEIKERILAASIFAAQMRTPVHVDAKTGNVDRIPFPEMPMRIALQFNSLAKGYMVIREHEKSVIQEEDIKNIEWSAYSLANEERRACLRTICEHELEEQITTQNIANLIGLDTAVVRVHLQILSAIGIVNRIAKANGELSWSMKNVSQYSFIRNIEGISHTKKPEKDEFDDF